MDDPFVTGLAALFRAPGSVAAVYTTPEGYTIPLRVIHHRGGMVDSFAGTPTVQGSNAFEIQLADIPEPERSAMVDVGTERFTLFGDPVLGKDGLSWICGAELAA